MPVKKMSPTRAIMDNTAFAGVMRLYCPDMEMHSVFLRNYPQHKRIDEQSLADFLTAVVIYDAILLETSSSWNERELERSGYRSETLRETSWAGALLHHLPLEIYPLVTECAGSPISEDESSRKAYDVMCSSLRDNIALRPGEKLPNVYFAEDYVYRPLFERLNRENNHLLNNNELAQAMFLHRGIFLQALAHKSESAYMPYHYRGRMLAHLPPMIWVQEPNDSEHSARLPLAEGNRPSEDDYSRKLNEYYYSLLETVSWKTYSRDIPFVGAAVLSKAKGNAEDAFKIALELRSEGTLKRTFSMLHEAVQNHDRPEFESILEDYQTQLQSAARHLGARLEDPALNGFYKLVSACLPRSIEGALEAAVKLLPISVRKWGRKAASTLLTKSSLQLLFVDHVRSIQRA